MKKFVIIFIIHDEMVAPLHPPPLHYVEDIR